MGNTNSMNIINFEDIQQIISQNRGIIINTLPSVNQTCLIKNTIPAANEEEIMDKCLQRRNFTIGIVVYGMNANDHSVYNKQQQLQKMGFSNVHVYPGGLFEWLCMQDIYGQNEFPTTSKELDILKYKARSKFTGLLLEYNT